MYYFSEQLIASLNEILHYPLTVITAGSGYGKTTAVKEYLLKQLVPDYRKLSYTCLGEPLMASWRGICRELEQMDVQTGQYLASLMVPSMEVMGEIARQMTYLSCTCDTIFYIDNFQLLDIAEKQQLIEALSLHRCEKLHIVIITQPLRQESSGFSYYHICAQDFLLSKQDVQRFFGENGQHLDEASLVQLYTTTEGYMAALRLQLDSQKRTGHLEPELTVSNLMEKVVWINLSIEERKCILALFVLQSFTLREGIRVCGWEQEAEVEKDMGNAIQAAKLYAKCKEFVGILQLTFKGEDRVELVQMENGLFVQGKVELFSQYLELVNWLLSMENEYLAERRNRLLGEYALMESFFRFNDIEQMCICHQRAYRLLKGPTQLYSLNTAWTFGIPSIVCMFWRKTGELRKELDQVTAGIPVYHQLSCGNGLGAVQAMAGEISLLAGEDSTALESYQRALYEADSMDQDSICYCAYLGMARIALLNGNVASYIHMQENIEDRAYMGKETRNVFTTGVCKGYLYMLLGQFDEMPEWLSRKEGIQSRSLVIALPFAHIIYARILLKQTREHKQKHEICMEEIQKLILESEQMNMLLPQLYFLIYQAVELDRNGEKKDAMVKLQLAMNMAGTDKVYYPFAENYMWIREMLDGFVLNENLREVRNRIQKLGMKFEKGRKLILASMHADKAKLTQRELEIAELLKDRYSVKEIASRLMISPSTVSNTMQSIYAKLEIHSKRELYHRTDL